MTRSKSAIIVCALLVLVSTPSSANAPVGTWASAKQVFSARQKHAAACNSASESILVYGGSSSTGANDDIWEYVGVEWFDNTGYIEGAPSLPARTAHTMVQIGINYLIFGGLINNEPSDSLVYYNTSRSQMSVITVNGVTIQPRQRHVAFYVPAQSKMIVFGGVGATQLFGDVWSYTPSTRTWAQHTHTDPGNNVSPSGRFNPVCSATTTTMYCFGGTTASGDASDMWRYAMLANSWTKLTTTGVTVQARRLGMSSIVGDRFFMFGGYSSETGKNIEDTNLLIFTISTSTWTSVQQTNPPKPRSSGVMCAYNNRITMLGGEDVSRRLRNDWWTINMNTLQFELKRDDIAQPDARAQHVAVMYGNKMMIALGQGAKGFLNDVWSFETSSGQWTQESAVAPALTGFSGLIGASAAIQGTSILVFGGQTSLTVSSAVSNKFYSYEILSKTWSLIETPTSPPARAFHACIAFQQKYIVFGGKTVSTDYASDLWRYDPVTQEWTELKQATNQPWPLGRHSFNFLFNEVSQRALILGGIGATEVFMDRWELSGNGTASGSTVTWTRRSSHLSGGTARNFIRGESAAIVSGNRVIVCGGSISDNFPSDYEHTCYQWDNNTGVNRAFDVSAQPTVHTFFNTLVYYGREVILYGGYIVSRTFPMKTTQFNSNVHRYSIDTAQLCAAGGTDDSNCFQCSPGTVNPTCTPVAPGRYVIAGNQNPSTCGKGTYQEVTGAQDSTFCIPCEAGTYSDTDGATSCKTCPAGSYCPVGSEAPQTEKNLATPVTINIQPAAHTQGDVPIEVYIIIAAILGTAVLVSSILFFLEVTFANSRRKYYIPSSEMSRLYKLYCEYYIKGEGLDLGALYALLQENFVGEDQQLSHMIVEKAKNARDADGSRFIEDDELLDIICDLLQDGHIPPLAGSAFAAGKPKPFGSGLVGSLSLSKVDFFDDKHLIGEPGDPIFIMRNVFGGFMTIALVIISILVVYILVMFFVYDNIVEVRSSLPQVVVTNTIVADIMFEAVINGDDNWAACAINTTAGITCPSWNTVKYGANLQVNRSALEQPQCQFITTHNQCRMTWWCRSCTLIGSADVDLVFGHSNAFATQILARVFASTGVENANSGDTEFSDSSTVFLPSSNLTVFRGEPDSKINVEMTPTVFSRPSSYTDTTKSVFTGYHVQTTSATKGNAIRGRQFNQFYTVPVEFVLSPATTTLTVQHEFKEEPLNLVTSILGAVSGISAACIIGLHGLDNISRFFRKREQKKIEESQKAANEPIEGGLRRAMSRQALDAESHKLVSSLTCSQINEHAATKIVTVARKISEGSLRKRVNATEMEKVE